jgi:transposase
MNYYAGIDLHSDNSNIGIINEKDRKIFKKKLPNDLNVIIKNLEPYKKHIRGIVVESTFNWYWLVDGMIEAGYKVHLANPSKMQQYSGLKYSDDNTDAFWLAHLLRLRILPEGYIYPKETRPVRDLLRKRIMLVRHRTAHKLSLQNMINRNKGTRASTNALNKLSKEDLNEMFSDKHHVMAADSDREIIDFLNCRIGEIEKVVLKQVKLRYPYEKLITVDGIGKILGVTIMLETGDINRIPTVSDYSSYCRCVSSRRLSNGKKKGEGNRKNGNKYLAWAYVEAANFMRRYCQKARSWYQRKAARTNQIVATKALANKVARACYYIIKDQTTFDSKKLFK